MYKRNSFSNGKYYSTLFILTGLLFSMIAPVPSKVSAASDTKGVRGAAAPTGPEYGQTPLLFEMNKGQTDKQVRFISRGSGYTLYLTENEAVFSLKVQQGADPAPEFIGKDLKQTHSSPPDVVRMNFVGAKEAPAIKGASEFVTKTNYYFGRKRIENVPNYGQVRYTNLYDGIDAVFYGNADGRLEYDLKVAPGADPGQIGLSFDGAENVSIDGSGDLLVKTPNAELFQLKPYTFQEVDGERQKIASRYVISKNNTVKFELGEYDRSKPLVIDPALTYLTYIGGTGPEDIQGLKVDSGGNAYITGNTGSLNFHGEGRNSNDGTGVFVGKLDPQGANFIYITILEGNKDDEGRGIALDPAGNVYVAGFASPFFPTTPGAFDTNHGLINDADAFVAKLNSSGVLIYSTFLGGSDSDFADDIAVDSSGKAYVTGTTLSSNAFPTKNRYQGCGNFFPATLNSADAFLTVLNSSGSDITYSTCIGGNATDDASNSIALDSSNNVYLTGFALGGNFPTKNAAQPNSGGGLDSWVAKLNPSSSGEASLIYSTYLGGSGTDSGTAIAVDPGGQAIVTGVTGSANFPLHNAFRTVNQVNEAFVTVIGASGNTFVNSSFLGGSDKDEGLGITLGRDGSIYVTGKTISSDFPMALPFQASRKGLFDSFVTKLKFGTGVISSTFLGGAGNDFGNAIAIQGNFIFVGGQTESGNLATTDGVIKTGSNASSVDPDGFVARILDTHMDSVGVFRPAQIFQLTQSTTNILGQNATFTSNFAGQQGVAGDWDGDGVDTIGSFTNGIWKVRNSNFPFVVGPPPIAIAFGGAGDLPVSGDWDGDGIDTPGIFRPSTGQFTLTNSTATNPSFTAFVTIAAFGTAGDLPISGDWDGNGKDSVAVYRPSTGETFFTNADLSFMARNPVVKTPGIDFIAFLGIAEDLPFAGDWNGDGKDSLGLFRPSTTEFILSDDNINLRSVFLFGQTGDQPIAGDWDGKPTP